MASLREVKSHARRLFMRGEAAYALRLYDAIVQAAPLDWDARMKVADCLVALGDRDAAADIYRAVAWFCLKSGHPLLAIVAARLLESLGRPNDDVLGAFVVMYGQGSDMLGRLAARLSPPRGDTEVLPPDLRLAPPPHFRAQAAARAVHCLDEFDDFPEALHPIPLLSEFSDTNLRRVLATMLVHRLPGDARVIREGELGRSFYFLAGGEVRVYNTDSLGRETELARLHEGSLFGEMALLAAQPRSASVAVVDEADLLEVSREALAAIANDLPQVASALDRFTRERLLKNLVATSPLFRPFSRVQQLDLLRRFTSHDIAAGTTLIRQGEEPRGLYVVLSGEVDVATADGVPLATLRAGDVFGEIALLRGGPTTAQVTAARHSTVLFLARDYFTRLVAAFPEIRQYFEELTEDRLMETKLILSDDAIVEEDERVLV